MKRRWFWIGAGLLLIAAVSSSAEDGNKRSRMNGGFGGGLGTTTFAGDFDGEYTIDVLNDARLRRVTLSQSGPMETYGASLRLFPVAFLSSDLIVRVSAADATFTDARTTEAELGLFEFYTGGTILPVNVGRFSFGAYGLGGLIGVYVPWGAQGTEFVGTIYQRDVYAEAQMLLYSLSLGATGEFVLDPWGVFALVARAGWTFYGGNQLYVPWLSDDTYTTEDLVFANGFTIEIMAEVRVPK